MTAVPTDESSLDDRPLATQAAETDAKRQMSRQPWFRTGVARGLAGFLGAFTLLNLLGEIRIRGFDANIWWIDLRALPIWAERTLLGAGGVGLCLYAVGRGRRVWTRWPIRAATGLMLLFTAANVLQFYRLLLGERVRCGMPVPFSLFVCVCLACVFLSQRRMPAPSVGRRALLVGVPVAAACTLLFPIAQMFCFGRTDYRRPADVAVILGARAYADGRPSDALADRVRTGCDLYRAGLVHRLVMSGGPGDGRHHETEVMKTLAIKLGVPEQAILIDQNGVNTQATVENTQTLFDACGADRVLIVSHFYHLPRIKMAYQRVGCEVYTVPARESYTLTWMPYFMLREVAALWAYYLRPLAP